jgi:sodium-coupled monocarboxylate transporter 8/12
MIGAVLIVMVLGTFKMGGVGNVFEIAERSGRLVWFKLVENFLFLLQDIINILLVWILIPSSAARYGPWMWMANVGVTQECVQRFISMPTFAEAKRFYF